MSTVQTFNFWNLTKRAMVVFSEGKWLGDMVDGKGVYSIYDFWVIVDEDYNETNGHLPSYLCVKSAEAVASKPYIDNPFDENNYWIKVVK